MSEKRYGGFEGGMGISPFAGYTLEQMAARCDDAAAVARDLIAAQARIAELEAEAARVHTREGCPLCKRATWRIVIEDALGVEPDPVNHTIEWAHEVIREIREIGNRQPGLSPPATSGPGDATAAPTAPLAIADLPDWWDARRARMGKPDRSTCAAELRVALARCHAWARRHRAQYPGFVLSVMAGAMDRCEPQRDGLPLESYTSVEVALIRGADYGYVLPSDLGVDGFDDLFDVGNDNIASFVDTAKLDALRAALAARCDVALPPLVAQRTAR